MRPARIWRERLSEIERWARISAYSPARSAGFISIRTPPPPPLDGLPLDGLPFDGFPFDGLPLDGLPFGGFTFGGFRSDGFTCDGFTCDGFPLPALPVFAVALRAGLDFFFVADWVACSI